MSDPTRRAAAAAEAATTPDAAKDTDLALPVEIPPDVKATDPALDTDADELVTEMSAPDPNTSADVSATNEADAVLAAIDVS